jgi:hypothetical protein
MNLEDEELAVRYPWVLLGGDDASDDFGDEHGGVWEGLVVAGALWRNRA